MILYTHAVVQSNGNLIICDYENQRVIVCESVSNGATVWKRANAKAITRYLFICWCCCCCFYSNPTIAIKKCCCKRAESVCMYVCKWNWIFGPIYERLGKHFDHWTKCKNTNAFNRHQWIECECNAKSTEWFAVRIHVYNLFVFCFCCCCCWKG